MPEFKYTLKERNGTVSTGTLNAPTEEAAVKILKERNCLILSVSKNKKSPFAFSFNPPSSSIRIKTDDLAVFSRQLATMVSAGLPLIQGLEILVEQSEKKTFKFLIAKVKEAVEDGSSLSEALSKYPRAFSALFVNMISAGEASGMLDDILQRMASYLEETSKLQKKVRSALVYPVVITLTAASITVFMLVQVVPSFAEIYSGFGAELPGPTRFLLLLSDLVTKWLFAFVLGIAVIAAGIFMFSKTERGGLFIDRMLLRLPIAGKLIRKVSISRFSRTLSTLAKSGVSILTSLDIVAKTSGNKVIEKVVFKVLENVKGGESIAQPLANSGIFPPLVVKMVAVGEQTGALEEMLLKVSDFYDAEVTATVDGLTSLIEPVIIVVLGVIIGGIVIALYLPVFNIAELIS
ncbi:MAG: type II secretion system F family protein [Candidatus Omnitrophica bacterium]|nr:type II secretion system F family protein [Candidatus Omnitrophota bacterium]